MFTSWGMKLSQDLWDLWILPTSKPRTAGQKEISCHFQWFPASSGNHGQGHVQHELPSEIDQKNHGQPLANQWPILTNPGCANKICRKFKSTCSAFKAFKAFKPETWFPIEFMVFHHVKLKPNFHIQQIPLLDHASRSDTARELLGSTCSWVWSSCQSQNRMEIIGL